MGTRNTNVFETIKEAFLQWVTDRRVKKSLVREWLPSVKKQLECDPKAVFLVLTPEHGNLGDHAIASAESTLLESIGISFIEVTEAQLWKLQKHGFLSVMNGRPIIVNGGGNLGTLWIGVEILQREIIKHNPDSPIFILPNTIFYEDSDYGKKEFEESKNIYNSHRNLYLYAREKNSYEVMKQAYNHVKLVPDMVLSLNKCQPGADRNGCILCLRNDCEKTRTEEEEALVMDQVRGVFGDNWRLSDMRLDYKVSPSMREAELEKKFEDFRRAELVVTDRLHGMIFCAITATPCVVMNSKSPKVKGCYDWICELGYIKMVEDATEIATAYNAVSKREFTYNEHVFAERFEDLKRDIQSIVNGKDDC